MINKITLASFVLVLVILTSCNGRQEIPQRNEFFAWMDAYLAVEKGTDQSVAVTMFYEQQPFDPEEIKHIAFTGINNQVVVNDYQIVPTELPNQKFSSFGIHLFYTANATGVFQTTGITITLSSNKSVEYPIGNWTFDVGNPGVGKVNTWDAPVATTNGTEFPYQYSLVSSSGIIKRIYFGHQRYIEDDNGIAAGGTINLVGHYASPIVYIKSKIVYAEGSEEFIEYGKGCYIGAVNFTEEVLQKSRERNITH